MDDQIDKPQTTIETSQRFPPNRGRRERVRLPDWFRLCIIISLGCAIGFAAFYLLRTVGY